jgi:putative glutamine amidotransferase
MSTNRQIGREPLLRRPAAGRGRRERPLIGITTGVSPAWQEGGRYYRRYAQAIAEAGGIPVRLGPEARRPAMEILQEVDGLLLAGGVDVDLRNYPHPPPLLGHGPEELMALRQMDISPERDRLEIPLTQAAVEAGVPALGICRGCQVLHVALGGHLVLDIPTELPAAIRHTAGPLPVKPSGLHEAAIEPESRLARETGLAGRHVVNTRHHQAVLPDSGSPLQVSAVSPDDGIVEAVELPTDSQWVIGVQWHPERTADASVRERYRPLFDAFVRAARGRR